MGFLVKADESWVFLHQPSTVAAQVIILVSPMKISLLRLSYVHFRATVPDVVGSRQIIL